MGFVGRAALPKVNYPTALDWFVILCFVTVFAVLVEYAVINFIDKVRVDIQRLLEERKKQKELAKAKEVLEYDLLEVVILIVYVLCFKVSLYALVKCIDIFFI